MGGVPNLQECQIALVLVMDRKHRNRKRLDLAGRTIALPSCTCPSFTANGSFEIVGEFVDFRRMLLYCDHPYCHGYYDRSITVDTSSATNTIVSTTTTVTETVPEMASDFVFVTIASIISETGCTCTGTGVPTTTTFTNSGGTTAALEQCATVCASNPHPYCHAKLNRFIWMV